MLFFNTPYIVQRSMGNVVHLCMVIPTLGTEILADTIFGVASQVMKLDEASHVRNPPTLIG